MRAFRFRSVLIYLLLAGLVLAWRRCGCRGIARSPDGTVSLRACGADHVWWVAARGGEWDLGLRGDIGYRFVDWRGNNSVIITDAERRFFSTGFRHVVGVGGGVRVEVRTRAQLQVVESSGGDRVQVGRYADSRSRSFALLVCVGADGVEKREALVAEGPWDIEADWLAVDTIQLRVGVDDLGATPDIKEQCLGKQIESVIEVR